MRFRKPPVVEVWISIDFDPNENKRQWDLDAVSQFVQLVKEEFPKMQVVREQVYQVQDTSPTDRPQVIRRDIRVQSVRLWTPTRSRMMQLADDQISFHLLKCDEEIPGYGKVRAEATPKLGEYSRVFRPSLIRHATLHYLDVIDIPVPTGGKLCLRDWFPQVHDLSEEPFGTIAALTQQFQVNCPTDPGPLSFQLQFLPSPPEGNVFRFRLEWHKQCAEINSLDLDQVWARMNRAHDYMRACFRAFLSDAALSLFEPIALEAT